VALGRETSFTLDAKREAGFTFVPATAAHHMTG
jgi:hypothetical protein